MTVLGLPWLGVSSYVDGLLIGLSLFFIDWAIPYGVQLFRCLGITVG